ncbi:hypothetical protein CspHIS471_0404020 [Cutaneotrichosporon sp. HIS471]|nr:hypothetical protein CspHIS471_0404020 [Cutaneotrichosporon sp. HIS471]
MSPNPTSATEPTSSTGAAPAVPSASTLPPEALSLASKLFDFARAGDPTLLEYIGAGIPPNLTNASGDTLLMLAAYHGHADLVTSLLSKGADPNALNGKGQAPIAGAVFKKHDEVVKVLFEAGADVTAGHPNARDCAVMFRREDLVELFNSK